MYNTRIENCNTELLEQQKQQLTNLIINERNPDYFKVFDMEAGCGKTLSAEHAIASLVKNSKKNVLFVRTTNKDCKESADRINAMCKKSPCLVYNNEALDEIERRAINSKLSGYRVICISHNKYLALSRASSNPFKRNRHVLIIDEFPADVKILKLSLKDIEVYKEYFVGYASLALEFEELFKFIKDKLLINDDKKALQVSMFEMQRGLKEKVREFQKKIKVNITQEDINRVRQHHPELNKNDMLASNINELSIWVGNFFRVF